MISPEKQTAFDWVDGHEQWLSDSHQVIWRHAEPAWREYKSAAWYVETLREHGFQVEAGSAGMPTAFCATYESPAGGGGPVLGSFAEYDAVPGNSQEPVPYEKRREGVHPWAAGHTDPHSALGMGTLAGTLAAKAAMEAHAIPGTLKYWASRRRRSAAPSRSTPPTAISTALTPSSCSIRASSPRA